MKHRVQFLNNKLLQLPRVCSTSLIPRIAHKNDPVLSSDRHLQYLEHNVIKVYGWYVKKMIKWRHKESDFSH